jgi:hypothetical protein
MKCPYLKEEKKREKKYRAKRSLWKVLFGYCPCCGLYFNWPVTTKRRHTQYCDEANNYMTSCKECHHEDDAYYDELWREYNAGRL